MEAPNAASNHAQNVESPMPPRVVTTMGMKVLLAAVHPGPCFVILCFALLVKMAVPDISARRAYAGRRGHAMVQSIMSSGGLWLQLVMRASVCLCELMDE